MESHERSLSAEALSERSAREIFESLKLPIETLEHVNPEVAKSLMKLYMRILEDLFSRTSTVRGPKRLSPERTSDIISALSSVKINLPDLH